MMRAILIGTGNLAWHLVRLLPSSSINWVGVWSPNEERLTTFSAQHQIPVCTPDSLPLADICFLAVRDSSLNSLAAQLAGFTGLVVHHSGATSLGVLEPCERRAVLYPFQTFTAGIPLTPENVPFFLEAKHPEDLELLRDLMAPTGCPVNEASSEQRLSLHVAGVLVNNFTNHLFAIADGWVQDHGIDPTHLRPLMKETLRKATEHPPAQVQTGPAKRGDLKTIRKHLRIIKAQHLRKLYKTLTDHIRRYG